MKVIISSPDEVFTETEELAKQLKVSRGEVYSRALKEFPHRHAPDRITDLMNQVIAAVNEAAETFTKRAARGVMRRVE